MDPAKRGPDPTLSNNIDVSSKKVRVKGNEQRSGHLKAISDLQVSIDRWAICIVGQLRRCRIALYITTTCLKFVLSLGAKDRAAVSTIWANMHGDDWTLAGACQNGLPLGAESVGCCVQCVNHPVLFCACCGETA